MNAALPKTKNSISALFQISVAGFVTFLVCLLDRPQGWVSAWISMPEISIPLDNDSFRWNENVHHEFATNNLLFFVSDPQRIKNHFSCLFEGIKTLTDGKPEEPWDSPLLLWVVSAGVGAIFNRAVIQSPAGNIERFSAGDTALNSPSASYAYGPLSGFVFSRLLPGICADDRAKTNFPVLPGVERLAAPFTGVCAAWVTPFRIVRTRGK